MTYQISRNGQIYGPYTLDDLKRYLASGNVLLTDLAKSDAMSDSLPVSQLLANDTAPHSSVPPATAPYEPVQPAATPNPTPGSAPYTAPYVTPGPVPAALAESPYPDPPSMHWALVALLTLLTCGAFMPVWNLIVNAWLKRVQPDAVALYYIGAYVLALLVWLAPGNHHAMMPFVHFGHHNWFAGILLAIHWVLKLIARFSEQASLEEHFNGPEPIGLTLNPAMTFFFGGLYFQYHLTRIQMLKQAARFGMPLTPRF